MFVEQEGRVSIFNEVGVLLHEVLDDPAGDLMPVVKLRVLGGDFVEVPDFEDACRVEEFFELVLHENDFVLTDTFICQLKGAVKIILKWSEIPRTSRSEKPRNSSIIQKPFSTLSCLTIMEELLHDTQGDVGYLLAHHTFPLFADVVGDFLPPGLNRHSFLLPLAEILHFLTKIFNNVPVFETGGRGATTAFTERQQGDVLITFEAEVQGIRKQLGTDKYDAVIPSVSLLAEFPVAIVDKVADARGSQAIAKAYIEFLYSPEGQEILASNFNRVHDEAVVAAHAADFPQVRLVTVEDAFGGWEKVSAEHFADGGLLDKVFLNQ